MTIIEFRSMRKGSAALVKARRNQAWWIVASLLTGAMVSVSVVALGASEGGKRDDLDALYLDLHAHPELAFQEHRTSELLADRVAALGFEVTRHVGRTGFVALLRNGDGPVVMLRTELDALPLEEKTGAPFASVPCRSRPTSSRLRCSSRPRTVSATTSEAVSADRRPRCWLTAPTR
jgi:hypothetical protein